MRTACVGLAFLMTLDHVASGQRLYWGVIGGTGLTQDLPPFDASAPADAYGNPAYHFQHLPGSRSFILGGLLEVKLSTSFAIEADILHRPLRATIIDTIFPASGPSVTTTNHFLAANTWEFPLMLKWSLPSPLEPGRVRPFLEGGATFRTSQDDSAALPSQFGMTAGVGAAIHFGKLRVAPTIRYTRWDKETHSYPTKADQVEFLTSVAWGTSSDPVHVTGHRLSLGVLGGGYPQSVRFTFLSAAESRNASAIWPGLRGNWHCAKVWRWRSMPSTNRCTTASAAGQAGLRC